MLEEGTFSDFYHKARKKVLKKKEEKKKKHQYPAGASGGDAGAEAKQKLKDKQHKKYVNFLPSNVDEEVNQEEKLMASLVKKYGTKKVEKAHKEAERRRKNKLSDKPITAEDLHDIIVYNNKRLGQEDSEDQEA